MRQAGDSKSPPHSRWETWRQGVSLGGAWSSHEGLSEGGLLPLGARELIGSPRSGHDRGTGGESKEERSGAGALGGGVGLGHEGCLVLILRQLRLPRPISEALVVVELIRVLMHLAVGLCLGLNAVNGLGIVSVASVSPLVADSLHSLAVSEFRALSAIPMTALCTLE